MKCLTVCVAVLLVFMAYASGKCGECVAISWGRTNITDSIPLVFSESVCDLPLATGERGNECDALRFRYHYDRAAGKCEKVVYDGCGGTANNFETLGQCEEACGDHDH